MGLSQVSVNAKMSNSNYFQARCFPGYYKIIHSRVFKIVNFIASTFIFRPIVLIFAFGSFGFKTISYSGIFSNFGIIPRFIVVSDQNYFRWNTFFNEF